MKMKTIFLNLFVIVIVVIVLVVVLVVLRFLCLMKIIIFVIHVLLIFIELLYPVIVILLFLICLNVSILNIQLYLWELFLEFEMTLYMFLYNNHIVLKHFILKAIEILQEIKNIDDLVIFLEFFLFPILLLYCLYSYLC